MEIQACHLTKYKFVGAAGYRISCCKMRMAYQKARLRMPKTHEKTSRRPVLPLLFTPPSRKRPHRVQNRRRLPNPIRYNRRNLSQPNPENRNRYILFQRIAARTRKSAPTPKCNILRLGALLRSHLPYAHASSLSATDSCGDVLWKTQAHVLSSSKRFFQCINCIILEVPPFVKRFSLSISSLPPRRGHSGSPVPHHGLRCSVHSFVC